VFLDMLPLALRFGARSNRFGQVVRTGWHTTQAQRPEQELINCRTREPTNRRFEARPSTRAC